MKSYILCCVDRLIFHSGLPHFLGGGGGGLWREYGVSGSGKYRRLFRQTDPRYVLSSIFRMKTRPKQGKPLENLVQGPKCPLSGPPNSSAATVDSPGERSGHIINKLPMDLKSLMRHSIKQMETLACLSSSSASSTKFFLNAATRRVLKSISSKWKSSIGKRALISSKQIAN